MLLQLQLNLPYCITESVSFSCQIREIFLDTRCRFFVEILVFGVGMIFFGDYKEYKLLKKVSYFISPKSGIPVCQNLRIINGYHYPEFFVRKGASTETMYNVFYFKNKVIKITRDK